MLTDLAIRKLKAPAKPTKIYFEKGLLLLHTPNGSKLWRFKYRFDGKEKLLALGAYPDVALKEAVERRDAARKLLSSGIDPNEHRKNDKTIKARNAANTFEAVAREWFGRLAPTWAESHSRRVMQLFERDIFPWLGSRPIADLATQPDEILRVLRRIEERGAVETAHRARSICGEVFLYAIPDRAHRNPCDDLRKKIQPSKKSNFAAVTEPEKIGELLRIMDGYNGGLVVRSALLLMPLVFVRPGELRQAEWKDIDLDTAEWRYLVTKTKTHHIVPLCHQAVEILQELHPLTGSGRYVFPSARSADRPMSNNAVLAAMRSMGIEQHEMCAHGFRATARTLLDEVLHYRLDIIEHQLAHNVRDPLGRAYNRTTHLPERKRMMQEWADYLNNLKSDNIKIGAA